LPEARLRLLATTDLHAQLIPWDLYADRAVRGRGLSRLATLIAEARAGAETCLLLDNGDFLTGSPLSDFPEAAGDGGEGNLVIAAMNRLGYDAAGIGNHEFSRGLPYLNRAVAQARFPVVNANVSGPDGLPLFAPRLFLHPEITDDSGETAPVCVGITSALPVQTALWERHHLDGRLTIKALLATIRSEVRLLRDKGAEVVVVLAHSGFGDENRGHRNRVNVARTVAAMPGVDAVIAGHTHDVWPLSPVSAEREAALVLPGAMGSHLGVIDLRLVRRGGRWLVAGHESALRAVQPDDGAPAAEEPGLAALAAPAVARLSQLLGREIGQTTLPLETRFALARDSAPPRLVARAMQDFVERSGLVPGLPVLAAVAPARTGGRGGPENYVQIPPGPLCERDLGALVPYDDLVAAVGLRGDDVRRWLEHAANLFPQIAPGARDVPLIRDEVPSFLFDAVYGLTYRIDLTVPPVPGGKAEPGQGRIRDLRWRGQPVRPGDRFVLATSSHRLAGGGAFPLPPAGREVALPQASLREVLRRALAGAPVTQSALAPPAWAFVPVPGATALLDTSPGEDAAAAGFEALGPAPGGFQRFRLHL
jgi:2',3'-cyclic-nucleotide 2'-phosphodiesterase/3'-nucleotidase